MNMPTDLTDEQIADRLAGKLMKWRTSTDGSRYITGSNLAFDWVRVGRWRPCQSHEQAAMVAEAIGKRGLFAIEDFERELISIVGAKGRTRDYADYTFTPWALINATPRQKCEAALRAIETK